MVKRTKSLSAGIFQAQPPDFWNGVNVFPAIISDGSAIKDYHAQALLQLRKCGAPNLRLLTERALLPVPVDATAEQLAVHLLSADKTQTLVCLAEFIRGKGHAINEEYAATFSPTKQRKHSAHLIEQSRNRLGSLKLFTKLVLLYEHDAESIRRIFVRKLWRGRNTTWEFLSPVVHDADFVRKLCRSTKSLADALSDAFEGYDLRFFTTVRMDGWQVILLQREYAPIVRPDFRDIQKTIHGFGWIMFAVELGKDRILMKGGGKKSLPIVRTWFDNQLQIELSDAEFDIVTTYDPQQVEAAFFGETTQDCPVQMAAISFHRTLAPGHSAMSIEPLFPGQDIQRDLQFAKEKGLLRIRSLSDIKSFRLRHNGKEAMVQVVACSPKLDPCVMRVTWPESGKEILDEAEEAHARADHQEAA